MFANGPFGGRTVDQCLVRTWLTFCSFMYLHVPTCTNIEPKFVKLSLGSVELNYTTVFFQMARRVCIGHWQNLKTHMLS